MLIDDEKRDLKQRLKRIAGQVNGIEKMVDEGRYCIDTIQQILAARAALNKVALLMLESHARSCVVAAVKEGHVDQSISELMDVIKQFNK